MVYTTSFTVLTSEYNQYLLITDRVARAVSESGVTNGMVSVISRHTTTGVMVNESLECLESDIDEFLGSMVPEEHGYAHARILKDYGSTAGNPTGHLKSMIVGNHAHFLVREGEIDRGGAQEIYFCEFDGPAERTVLIQVMGE